MKKNRLFNNIRNFFFNRLHHFYGTICIHTYLKLSGTPGSHSTDNFKNLFPVMNFKDEISEYNNT